MSDQLIIICFVVYTLFLFFIAWKTSQKATNATYFIGNRSSPWYLVAYGMIGTSLSGVTFISVPGWVGASGFTYMMVVFGYILGYLSIIAILLPVYYRLKLTSIYAYLDSRFGPAAYKTGSVFFLISRLIGAAFRMFIVVEVLQLFVFDAWNIPFWLIVCAFVMLILLYSIKGGIRTIVFTDTLQTTFMLLAVGLSIYYIKSHMGLGWSDLVTTIRDSEYSRMIDTDWMSDKHYLKQIFSGMFIAIVMTGLDQDMMQKNLSCRSLKDAQKNMFSLSMVLVVVNLVFLSLGVLLYQYVQFNAIGLPEKSDHIFPMIALEYLGPIAASVFIIGLISAAYSSADSAITALTTSFSLDILNLEKWQLTEILKRRIRMFVHFGVSVVLISLMLIFKEINDEAVISSLFTIAGYTYGPLLGFYAFGLFTKRRTPDIFVPFIGVASPVLIYLIKQYALEWYNYPIGFELLIYNGALTFLFMFAFSLYKPDKKIIAEKDEKFQIQSR